MYVAALPSLWTKILDSGKGVLRRGLAVTLLMGHISGFFLHHDPGAAASSRARVIHIDRLNPEGHHDMASRPEIKVKKSEPEEAQPAPSQQVKKETGNYRLQVDRQTKAFYMTEEAAQTAGLVIKKGHPVVQVSIYNSAEGINKIIELPS
jgi:hypothetical protein